MLMNKSEIINYIELGKSGKICIYRSILLKDPTSVMSIYLVRNRKLGDLGYRAFIEFDPIDLVDQGEGLEWKSNYMALDSLIALLEEYLEKDMSDWENINKSGYLDFYEGPIEPIDESKLEGLSIIEHYRSLLPQNESFTWKPKQISYHEEVIDENGEKDYVLITRDAY